MLSIASINSAILGITGLTGPGASQVQSLYEGLISIRTALLELDPIAGVHVVFHEIQGEVRLDEWRFTFDKEFSKYIGEFAKLFKSPPKSVAAAFALASAKRLELAGDEDFERLVHEYYSEHIALYLVWENILRGIEDAADIHVRTVFSQFITSIPQNQLFTFVGKLLKYIEIAREQLETSRNERIKSGGTESAAVLLNNKCLRELRWHAGFTLALLGRHQIIPSTQIFPMGRLLSRMKAKDMVSMHVLMAFLSGADAIEGLEEEDQTANVNYEAELLDILSSVKFESKEIRALLIMKLISCTVNTSDFNLKIGTRQTRVERALVEAMITEAIQDGAFRYLVEQVMTPCYEHVFSDFLIWTVEDIFEGCLTKEGERNEVVVDPETEYGASVPYLRTAVQVNFVRILSSFLIMIVGRLGRVLKDIRAREEVAFKDHEARMEMKTREPPYSNVTQSPDSAEPQFCGFFDLYRLLAVLYYSSEDAATAFWNGSPDQLSSFLSWCGDLQLPITRRMFHDMLAALAKGPQASEHMHKYLRYLQGMPSHGGAPSWNQVFEKLQNSVRHLDPVQAVAQHGQQLRQRPLEEKEQALLVSQLGVLQTVIKYNTDARVEIYDMPSVQVVHNLVMLLTCKVQSTLKAMVMKTLAAFALPGVPNVHIVKQRLWDYLDETQMVPTGQRARMIPDSHLSLASTIASDVVNVEMAQKKYPSLRAYVELIHTLIATRAHSNDALQVESEASLSLIKARSKPYVKFVVDDVLMRLNEMPFFYTEEREALVAQCLKLIDTSLESLRLEIGRLRGGVGSARSTATSSAAIQGLVQHPGFELLHRLLSQRRLLDSVTQPLQNASVVSQPGQAAVFHALRIIYQVLVLEEEYLETIYPDLVISPHSGRLPMEPKSALPEPLAPLEMYLLRHSDKIVELAMCLGKEGTENAVVVAALQVLRLLALSKHSTFGEFELGGGNKDKVVRVLKSAGRWEPVLEKLHDWLSVETVDVPYDDIPLEIDQPVSVRHALLDVLLSALGPHGRIAPNPAFARFLLGFDTSRGLVRRLLQDIVSLCQADFSLKVKAMHVLARMVAVDRSGSAAEHLRSDTDLYPIIIDLMTEATQSNFGNAPEDTRLAFTKLSISSMLLLTSELKALSRAAGQQRELRKLLYTLTVPGYTVNDGVLDKARQLPAQRGLTVNLCTTVLEQPNVERVVTKDFLACWKKLVDVVLGLTWQLEDPRSRVTYEFFRGIIFKVASPNLQGTFIAILLSIMLRSFDLAHREGVGAEESSAIPIPLFQFRDILSVKIAPEDMDSRLCRYGLLCLYVELAKDREDISWINKEFLMPEFEEIEEDISRLPAQWARLPLSLVAMSSQARERLLSPDRISWIDKEKFWSWTEVLRDQHAGVQLLRCGVFDIIDGFLSSQAEIPLESLQEILQFLCRVSSTCTDMDTTFRITLFVTKNERFLGTRLLDPKVGSHVAFLFSQLARTPYISRRDPKQVSVLTKSVKTALANASLRASPPSIVDKVLNKPTEKQDASRIPEDRWWFAVLNYLCFVCGIMQAPKHSDDKFAFKPALDVGELSIVANAMNSFAEDVPKYIPGMAVESANVRRRAFRLRLCTLGLYVVYHHVDALSAKAQVRRNVLDLVDSLNRAFQRSDGSGEGDERELFDDLEASVRKMYEDAGPDEFRHALASKGAGAPATPSTFLFPGGGSGVTQRAPLSQTRTSSAARGGGYTGMHMLPSRPTPSDGTTPAKSDSSFLSRVVSSILPRGILS